MSASNHPHVSRRVLKLNVGFLLNDGPGHSHLTEFDAPRVRVDEDLDLTYIRGPLRLSRTKEGILVQGHLLVGLEGECSRCLEATFQEIRIEIEELYSYPALADVEFSVQEDAILDLAPLLRAEVLIVKSRGVLCRPDCRGLCPECGCNLNYEQCDCAADTIDPRLAGLKELLNRK